METEMVGIVISQGAWASLFVMLLMYVLKTNDRRETKYQETICELTKQHETINDIQSDVCDIKNMIERD